MDLIDGQSLVSNSLLLAKESDNILKNLSYNPPTPVVVTALGLVDKSLVNPLPSHAVKLIAAIVVHHPFSIPLVCVIVAVSR